jgi:hypothetical protein
LAAAGSVGLAAVGSVAEGCKTDKRQSCCHTPPG